jgi:hypothetical protein
MGGAAHRYGYAERSRGPARRRHLLRSASAGFQPTNSESGVRGPAGAASSRRDRLRRPPSRVLGRSRRSGWPAGRRDDRAADRDARCHQGSRATSPKPSACRRPQPTSWRPLLLRELPKPSRRCGASTSASRWMRSSTWEPASRPIGSFPKSRPSVGSYSACSTMTEPIHASRHALKLRLSPPSSCGQTPADGVFETGCPSRRSTP